LCKRCRHVYASPKSLLHVPPYIYGVLYIVSRGSPFVGVCVRPSLPGQRWANTHTHGASVQLRCTNEMKYYVYVTSVHWPANKHTRTMAARLELPAGRRICQSYCCTRCTAQQAAPPPIFFMGITHMENGRELLLHRCRLHLPRGKLGLTCGFLMYDSF